jgi:hypothetical protein
MAIQCSVLGWVGESGVNGLACGLAVRSPLHGWTGVVVAVDLAPCIQGSVFVG